MEMKKYLDDDDCLEFHQKTPDTLSHLSIIPQYVSRAMEEISGGSPYCWKSDEIIDSLDEAIELMETAAR